MKPDTRSFYEVAVRRGVASVIEHLDDAIDLDALAREAMLSPFHFHRVFRGMTGETPLELHRRLRLERAAWALARSESPVTRIAFDAGYETHESFTRAFGARYACPPSAFRQRAQERDPAGGREPRTEIAARSGMHYRPGRNISSTLHIIHGDTPMTVDIKDMPELRVAAMPHSGPYNRIGDAFARLGAVAGPAQLARPGATMLAIYHDDPETTPVAELRSHAGLVVDASAPIPNSLEEQRIPGGRYACTTHTGPYEALGDVWSRLMGEWLPQSGHRMKDGVSYEVYRNTPMDTAPEKLVTELYIPLA